MGSELGPPFRSTTVTKDIATVALGSITTIWTPATGKKIRVLGLSVSSSAAVNLLLEDNSSSAANFVWRTPKLLADTPYTFDFSPSGGFLLSAKDNVLKATTSGAANVTGTVWGIEE